MVDQQADATILPAEVFLKRVQKPEHSRLDAVLAHAASRVYSNYMYNIGISGITGSGKSTLAIRLGMRAMGKKFSLSRNIAYTRDEIIQKAYDLPHRSVLIVDEAIGAQRRRAMEKIQKQLTEMINKIRYKNHIIIWNLPFFVELDPMLRKHFDLWIHVYDRGKAAVLIRNYNPIVADPWMPYKWVRRYSNAIATTPEDVHRMLAKHPLYRFSMHFPKLPASVEAVYVRLSEVAKRKLENPEKEKPFIRALRTNSATLYANYVIMSILLTRLKALRKITKKDIEMALKGVVLKQQIEQTGTDLLKRQDWFPPPDISKWFKQIESKAAKYADNIGV